MIHFSSLREFMAHLRGRDFSNKSTAGDDNGEPWTIPDPVETM